MAPQPPNLESCPENAAYPFQAVEPNGSQRSRERQAASILEIRSGAQGARIRRSAGQVRKVHHAADPARGHLPLPDRRLQGGGLLAHREHPRHAE